jgi:hypothetical protein
VRCEALPPLQPVDIFQIVPCTSFPRVHIIDFSTSSDTVMTLLLPFKTKSPGFNGAKRLHAGELTTKTLSAISAAGSKRGFFVVVVHFPLKFAFVENVAAQLCMVVFHDEGHRVIVAVSV